MYTCRHLFIYEDEVVCTYTYAYVCVYVSVRVFVDMCVCMSTYLMALPTLCGCTISDTMVVMTSAYTKTFLLQPRSRGSHFKPSNFHSVNTYRSEERGHPRWKKCLILNSFEKKPFIQTIESMLNYPRKMEPNPNVVWTDTRYRWSTMSKSWTDLKEPSPHPSQETRWPYLRCSVEGEVFRVWICRKWHSFMPPRRFHPRHEPTILQTPRAKSSTRVPKPQLHIAKKQTPVAHITYLLFKELFASTSYWRHLTPDQSKLNFSKYFYG